MLCKQNIKIKKLFIFIINAGNKTLLNMTLYNKNHFHKAFVCNKAKLMNYFDKKAVKLNNFGSILDKTHHHEFMYDFYDANNGVFFSLSFFLASLHIDYFYFRIMCFIMF